MRSTGTQPCRRYPHAAAGARACGNIGRMRGARRTAIEGHRRAVARAGFGAVALAALVLAACATLAPKPLPPRVAVESIRLQRLDLADARFRLTLAVQNPNAYDLTVNALDFTLAVEGEPFVAGALAAPVLLPALGEAKADVDARSSLGAVTAVLDKLSRTLRARYEVAGTAVVNDGPKLPFRRAGELPALDLKLPPR